MAEYSKDSIKVNYDSQAESFKPGATLRAAQMASIDQAIVASADAEKVAEALSEIDNKTDVLTNQVGTVPDGSTVMEEIEDIRSSTEEELAKKATGYICTMTIKNYICCMAKKQYRTQIVQLHKVLEL